jgi:hypothetical protein
VFEDVVSCVAHSNFTFKDGGLITVIAMQIGQKTETKMCTRKVMYREGKGGSF